MGNTCYSAFTWRDAFLPILVALIAQSFILPSYLQDSTNKVLRQELTLTPGTTATKRFLKPNPTIHLAITAISIENPDELLNKNNSLPRFKTIKSIEVIANETRINPYWNVNQTELRWIDCPILQYKNKENELRAKGTYICVLNPLLSILAQQYDASAPNSLERDEFLAALLAIAKTSSNTSNRIFYRNVSIHDYLFGSNDFGIFRGHNCSESERTKAALYFGVDTGIIRPENVGQMKTVENKSYLPQWKSILSPGNRVPVAVNGWYGMMGIDRLDGGIDEKMTLFDVTLKKSKPYRMTPPTTSRLGIPVTKYVHTFEDRQCGGVSTIYFQDDCQLKGTYNLSNQGFPSILSSAPYYLNAPELKKKLIDVDTGLRQPDQIKDEEYILIERTSGVVVAEKKALMLSFTLVPLPISVATAFNAPALAISSRSTLLILPSVIEERTNQLNMDGITSLHDLTVFLPRVAFISLMVGRICLPLLMLLAMTSLCYINRLKKLNGVSDYDGKDCCTHPSLLLNCPICLLFSQASINNGEDEEQNPFAAATTTIYTSIEQSEDSTGNERLKDVLFAT